MFDSALLDQVTAYAQLLSRQPGCWYSQLLSCLVFNMAQSTFKEHVNQINAQKSGWKHTQMHQATMTATDLACTAAMFMA
jgi:hypothetical protein